MANNFTMQEASSPSSITTEASLADLLLSPKRTSTDEGMVEERSVDELIKGQNYASGLDAADSPLFGLRMARFKPGRAS